jgi:hypothetical protein
MTRASFIVRVVRDRRGTGCGVIERVATGAKEAFPGVEAIGPVIARMGGAGGGRPTVEQHDRQRGGPPQRVWDASSSCPSREDAAACLVGRSTNRHSDIRTDLKHPSFCGVTRAVRLPRRRRAWGRGSANERCPLFPGDTTRLHWGFDDPSRATGTEDERLGTFRRVRDEIETRLLAWLAATR